MLTPEIFEDVALIGVDAENDEAEGVAAAVAVGVGIPPERLISTSCSFPRSITTCTTSSFSFSLPAPAALLRVVAPTEVALVDAGIATFGLSSYSTGENLTAILAVLCPGRWATGGLAKLALE